MDYIYAKSGDFLPVDLSLFPLSFRVLVLAGESVHLVGLAYVLV